MRRVLYPFGGLLKVHVLRRRGARACAPRKFGIDWPELKWTHAHPNGHAVRFTEASRHTINGFSILTFKWWIIVEFRRFGE